MPALISQVPVFLLSLLGQLSLASPLSGLSRFFSGGTEPRLLGSSLVRVSRGSSGVPSSPSFFRSLVSGLLRRATRQELFCAYTILYKQVVCQSRSKDRTLAGNENKKWAGNGPRIKHLAENELEMKPDKNLDKPKGFLELTRSWPAFGHPVSYRSVDIGGVSSWGQCQPLASLLPGFYRSKGTLNDLPITQGLGPIQLPASVQRQPEAKN